MEKIALPLSEYDFKEYLSGLTEVVGEWKAEGLGRISITCQLAKMVSEEDPRWSYTSGQLKRIFDLAK